MKKAASPKPKWDFAIGTTSRVPGRPGYHYLIMDVDYNAIHFGFLATLKKFGATAIVMQPTESGWHVYTNLIYSWKQLFHFMPSCCDSKWVSIGKKRGYLYLADKSQIVFPWPVERMILHFDRKAYDGKRKALNSRRAR